MLTSKDLDNLRHMLGAIPERYTAKQWGFRNYYASGKGGDALESMHRLVNAGFARQGHESESMIYFHATEEGCKAVGMNKAQIKRAFED